MQVRIEDVEKKVVKLLSRNLTKKEATRVVEPMIWSEMAGVSTQGLIKLVGPNGLQHIVPKGKVTVEKDTKLSALINCNGNPGFLGCQAAADLVVKKAKKKGFAIVGVHGYTSSTGVLAFFANKIVSQDLIGIVMTRSPATVAPFGSIEPLFGTNPMAFAFPTNDNPLIFDMATSGITWFGLVQAKMRAQPIPKGVAIDKDGNITEDPAKAMDGAILPFGAGYKGSGLGMVVEIMAGLFANATYCDTAFDKEWGSILMAIDPSLLIDLHRFKQGSSDIAKRIRSARKKSGAEPVRLPSDRMWAAYHEAKKTGTIDLDAKILEEIGLKTKTN